MKKRFFLLFGALLGVFAIGGVVIASNQVQNVPVYAEEEPMVEEVFECVVTIAETSHGKITVDKEFGHAGDIVNITAKHDLFYLVDHIAVNGVNLVESEETSGLYSFALVEGENKITGSFVVDADLLGEMSTIYDQARNKDWTHLFSVENVIRVVVFLLDGGLLIAIVRYYIKDKKLESKIEKAVKETTEKVVPETTKQAVVKCAEEVFTPMFSSVEGNQTEIMRILGVFIKCFALSQENTPEARQAILAELANLNVGDSQVIENAKKVIEAFINERLSGLENTLGRLDKIIEDNQPVEEAPVEKVENDYDGTQI